MRRAQFVVSVLASGALGVSLASWTAPATATPRSTSVTRAATTLPDGLREIRVVHSLLGTHTWYEQVSQGYPVVGGWYVVHTSRDGGPRVDDGRVPDSDLALPAADETPDIAPGAAIRAVTAKAGAPSYRSVDAAGLWLLPATETEPAHLVYAVNTTTGKGARVTYVDAQDAEVVASEVISASKAADPTLGKARVLIPNPVVKLQNQDLKDRNDAGDAVPAAGYTEVTLHHLRQHTLKGLWVTIVNKNRPVVKNNDFHYWRQRDVFEQVNAYHAIDRAQTWLHRLGFTDVNAESQRVRTDAFEDDNSFYNPADDLISFGSGGVDDAEDPEVVWHEYGHAIQDAQVPGFGRSELAGAIGEGFGDYFANAMAQGYSTDTPVTPLACVMDWDATSYTSDTPHCLRRTDGTKVYPADLDHEVHDDGEIWSRALWDIDLALGREQATRIIVEAQFNFTPRIGFVTAAQRTVEAAQALSGDAAATAVQQAFADRGILPAPS